MKKKLVGYLSRTLYILMAITVIAYPTAVFFQRLPIILEGKPGWKLSFLTGLTVKTVESSPSASEKTETLPILLPDEGAIPYIAEKESESDSSAQPSAGEESPPDDAEEILTLTIPSKIEPKNSPEAEFDLAELRKQEISFDRTKSAILIIHSHGSECYSEYSSVFWCENMSASSQNTEKNVVAVGSELKKALETYGFTVYHNQTLCDIPDYKSSYPTALKVIQREMEEHPDIGMVLDLHRDSVLSSDGTRYRLLSGDGEAAQLMFVVGTDILLEHPGWRDNLAFALALQKDLMICQEDLVRPCTLSKNRYNQHMTPFSLIIECGTEANTLPEAKRAVRRLAKSIDRVLS